VIITDAMHDWLAFEKFDYEFFKRLYRSNSSALQAVDDYCQFFPYKNADEFESLGDVFKMDSDRAHMISADYRPWYVGWSNCDYSTAYLLRQYYSRPYFLPKQSESSKLDWIFMVGDEE
jgi:histone arginine demethylase JMJD6